MSLLLAGLLTASVTNAQKPKLPHRLLVSAIYKLYTVNESRDAEWVYEHVAEKNPVILDAWALANGSFLFSHRYGALEMNPAKKTVWEYTLEQKEPIELHSCSLWRMENS